MKQAKILSNLSEEKEDNITVKKQVYSLKNFSHKIYLVYFSQKEIKGLLF